MLPEIDQTTCDRELVTLSSTKSPLTRGWVRSSRIPGAGTCLLLVLAAIAATLVSIASAPGALGLLGAGLALVMLTIAVIDARSFVIPNWLNGAGLALALVHAAIQQQEQGPDLVVWAGAVAVLRGSVLAMIFLVVRNVYAYIRGRQGLGLGDVKLAAVAGAWLGWSMIPIAVEIAALAALSVYVLRQLVFGQPMRATNRVPFGLFFAPAVWVCWLLEAALL